MPSEEITITGNLAANPQLRSTREGKPVTTLRLLHTARVRVNDQWQDGPTTAYDVSVFDTLAEHAVKSLTTGTRVLATGHITGTRAYVPKEGGDPRAVIEFTASEVGPSLKWATAEVTRVAKTAERSDPGPDLAGGF